METIKLQSWGDFRDALKCVREKYGSYEYRTPDGTIVGTRKNRILFRGQSNATWHVTTTLERKSSHPYDLVEYMRLATAYVKELESFTGNRWKVDEFPVLKAAIENSTEQWPVDLRHYDYLVYLRQFGFPSPLLDWTESPYIAAYFSYLETHDAVNVAVYCYIEYTLASKGFLGGTPHIDVKGPYVRTHIRHFAQKAWYTLATKWEHGKKAPCFCSHELAFDGNDRKQDVVIKIELPASARKEALQELNEYNINHFTLFQSEESLVKALELRAFDLG